jgi:arylsulfatase A-like enzyme
MGVETTCNRRCFLQAMGLGAAALALPRYARGGTASAQKRPPNILLIVSDDQGYNDLGCYGGEEILTPNQDRLANEGVRLTSFYVAWPACTPSRGSFLTGRYPQRNGTYDMYRNEKPDYGYKYPPEEYAVTPERILGMDVREVLIPRVLKQAGYTSGIYGKWDLGQLKRFLPLQRGFDDFYGFVNTGIDYYTHERYGVPSMYRNNEPTTEDKGEYCTWLFTREAKRFIRENKDLPFFCYVPYNAPHIASVLESPKPVQAPDEYKAMYPAPKNEREARRIEYMAAVTAMDHGIGELLNLLDEIGQADNTIVIYFSDNGGGGPADNAPLRGRKGQTYEGGVRVPCIVRWPGVVPADSVCDEFLTSMEFFPTLANAAGAPLPEGVVLDGFDARDILAGMKPSPRNEMFWVRRNLRGARVGNWKWVDMDGKGGLFDLSNDIGEEHDLSEEKPEVLRHVLSRFENWKAEMEAAEPRRPFRDF